MQISDTLNYGLASTPFGEGLIGWTGHGIVMLHLLQPGDPEGQAFLKQRYQNLPLRRADSQACELLEQAFSQQQYSGLKLALQGSPFQIKVWQGLREIPFGEVRTYGELAHALGHPGAARAVGSALAANQIAYIVPCHRVIRATGERGQYRWGAERKTAMLEWEAHQLARANADR